MSNPTTQTLHDGIFVIFGVTGDLSKRKLLPALYQLVRMDMLSQNFKIIGTTRRETEIYQLISDAEKYITAGGETIDREALNKLRNMLCIVHMNISNKDDYEQLKQRINEIEAEAGYNLNRHYYMAVPPHMFEPIVTGLGASGLNKDKNNIENRLLIEKPFGHDSSSALELIKHIEAIFDERAIYRVDHYLAKETAQNILTFRTSNPIFKAVWDCKSIDHILITASEKIGIEDRVNFYESTGALRDLIQSHLIQLLALITMEEPIDNSAEAIHASKLALLHDIQPIDASEVEEMAVRGQYESYKSEVRNLDSKTETFAAIRLTINNERWKKVPVLLRTGKALHEKITEITLVFKSRGQKSDDNNMLTIRIQPNEGIVLSLRAKKPSLDSETDTVQMGFSYSEAFTAKQPDAYERVLVDAIRGDKTLFTTDEEVLASWRIIEAVLQAWKKNDGSMIIYESGSWGPPEANLLAEKSGAAWHTHRLKM